MEGITHRILMITVFACYIQVPELKQSVVVHAVSETIDLSYCVQLVICVLMTQ